jgi:hypothetical protein
MGKRRRGALGAWRLDGAPSGKAKRKNDAREGGDHGAHSGAAV